MSLTYENPVGWRKAGQILTGTLLITAAFAGKAMVPINGGPVTQAGTTDNDGSPPAKLTISSPAVSDVVKMVDAKVDPTVIKAFIQNATTTFNPSANDLIALKNHGVPDDILTAMLQRGAQVRTQIAQALQKPPPAPSYEAAPPPAVAPAPEATYASYPADYATYAAPYADYSYAYPYSYSYPYYWWYNYSYPYYSYWPYYGYYGRYYSHYGHGYYHHHGDGHYHPGWPGNHPTPHSNGTFAGRPNGPGRVSPYAPVGSRPTTLAMGRSAYAPVSSAARPASFAAHVGGGVHTGAGFSGHASGGHGGGGGGGHAGGGHR